VANCQEAGQLSFDPTPTRRVSAPLRIRCRRTATGWGRNRLRLEACRDSHGSHDRCRGTTRSVDVLRCPDHSIDPKRGFFTMSKPWRTEGMGPAPTSSTPTSSPSCRVSRSSASAAVCFHSTGTCVHRWPRRSIRCLHRWAQRGNCCCCCRCARGVPEQSPAPRESPVATLE
jgi:hypothetical protein